MAYCTAAEVLDMLKEDMLNVIIGDNYIENEDERIQAITPIVEQAIADADAEIDGYLAKRYKVPFEKTPQVINKFAKDIALYNLIYAATHQFGDERTIRAKKGKHLKFQIGDRWISKPQVSVKIPAREFLGISQQDDMDIQEMLKELFEE